MTMKSKATAVLLAFFLGGIGAHKFYLKKYWWGVIYLAFCWTYIPSIIGAIEAIMYLVSSESDFQAKYCDKESQMAYRSSRNTESNLHLTNEYTPPMAEPQRNISNYMPLELPRTSTPPIMESQSDNSNYTPLEIPKASTPSNNRETAQSAPPLEKSIVDDSQAPMELSDEEKEYVEEFRLYNADGIISEKERRLLDKLRELSGISKDRATYLESLTN